MSAMLIEAPPPLPGRAGEGMAVARRHRTAPGRSGAGEGGGSPQGKRLQRLEHSGWGRGA